MAMSSDTISSSTIDSEDKVQLCAMISDELMKTVDMAYLLARLVLRNNQVIHQDEIRSIYCQVNQVRQNIKDALDVLERNDIDLNLD